MSSVLLGSSNPEQLIENLGAIQASKPFYVTSRLMIKFSQRGYTQNVHGLQKECTFSWADLDIFEGRVLIIFKHNVSLSKEHFCCLFYILKQVLPKMTSHIVNEVDNILGNKPYSKKDYRS